MITTGIIREININGGSYTNNMYRVELPIFNTPSNTNGDGCIMECNASLPGGVYSSYAVGDMVYIGFVNNSFNHPVILGKIYKGLTEEPRSYAFFDSLKVNGTVELPKGVKIDGVSLDETLTRLGLDKPTSTGGTNVEANPTDLPTDVLSKIKIDSKVYSIQGGGGGSTTWGNILGNIELQTDLIDKIDSKIGEINIRNGSALGSLVQEGVGSPNTANGIRAVALGSGNTVEGVDDFTYGALNYIQQSNSISFGSHNSLRGKDQIIIGQSTSTSEEGSKLFSLGVLNKLEGYSSFAFGSELHTKGYQTAVGTVNDPDDTITLYDENDEPYDIYPMFMVGHGSVEYVSVGTPDSISYYDAIDGNHYTESNSLITPAFTMEQYNRLSEVRVAQNRQGLNVFAVYPNGDIKYTGRDLSDNLESILDIGNGHNIQQKLDKQTFTVNAPFSSHRGEVVTTGSTGSKASASFNGSSRAPGSRAFSANSETSALGDRSATFNNQSVAEAANAFACNNMTVAKAPASFACGEETCANGQGSFVSGRQTKTNAAYQAAFGKYNLENSSALLLVGNGSSDSDRSNAFTVFNDGHAEVKTNMKIINGNLQIGNTTLSETQLTKLLALLDTMEAQ